MDLDLLDLDEIQPPHVLDEGQYKLEIIKEPERVQSKKNEARWMIRVYLKSVEEPDSQPIMENLVLPNSEDPPENVVMFGRRIKAFCECFAIPFEGSSAKFEGSKGATGWALVKKAYNEAFDSDQNEVGRFMLAK